MTGARERPAFVPCLGSRDAWHRCEASKSEGTFGRDPARCVRQVPRKTRHPSGRRSSSRFVRRGSNPDRENASPIERNGDTSKTRSSALDWLARFVFSVRTSSIPRFVPWCHDVLSKSRTLALMSRLPRSIARGRASRARRGTVRPSRFGFRGFPSRGFVDVGSFACVVSHAKQSERRGARLAVDVDSRLCSIGSFVLGWFEVWKGKEWIHGEGIKK